MVTATYPPSTNGVAISTKRAVVALRAAGHVVAVLGPEHKNMNESYYYTFQTVYHVPGMPSDYPLVLPWMAEKTKKEINKNTWDIVHVHHPAYVSRMALKIGERCRAPVVFTYHSQYDHVVKSGVPFFPDWLHELIFYVGTASVIGNMAAIIAPSKWLEKELKEKFPEIPIYYVSTAGLPRPFALNTSSRTLRKQLSLPLKEPLFIIVSRLSNEKNVPFVVTAFTKWASSHEKGKLLIIGDGNSRGDLEQMVRKLRITRRVVFTGSIPNPSLAPWLNAADIFLYSSTTDTVSVNIIEAMSAGLPVVAIDDKSTREIITHGVNGYLSPPQVDTFVSYMVEALQHKKTLSRGAKEQVCDYALSTTSTALVKTYEQIIQCYQS